MNTSPKKSLVVFSAVAALFFIFLAPTRSRPLLHAKESPPVFFSIPASDISFFIGEELQYNVSYSFFDIGLIKMSVLDTATVNGVRIYKMKAFVDSYSGLPFVDLHQVFYSELSADAFSSFFVTYNTAKPEKKPFTRYTFDCKNNTARFDIGVDPGNIIQKSGEEKIDQKQLDGLSLFFYARKNFREQKKVSVPVFVNEKSYKTNFNFMNKLGATEIDAVSYPVETIEFDGTSDFTGVFGLTGYFKGFFSNDDAGVPIVAKMKVILGSVHIELIKWTRPGWIPPKAKE